MEEIKTTYQGFAEIARIIREGKLGQLHIGDTISTRHTLRDRLLWRIIGINADAALDGTPETVTVMLCNPPIWCSFDGGRKGFPYGCNEWEPSDVRARLQGDVLDGFDAEDRAVIVPVRKATYSPQNERIRHTSDKLFLLSASEIGIAVDDDAIHDEGKPYAYFEDGDDEKRRLTDADGDSCYWRLRSPNPWGAGYLDYIRIASALKPISIFAPVAYTGNEATVKLEYSMPMSYAMDETTGFRYLKFTTYTMKFPKNTTIEVYAA